ncbi:MAG: PEP-CTERM sorting domain-containing protein [Paucibacter sp.]|nr:PEP-CTERM sorting domain-containing protein [Roseateles sp.]
MQLLTSQGVSFEAYCVELTQGHAPTAAGFQTYTQGSFTSSQASLLQGLYSSSYASVSTDEQKAAFQTAIWEIMEEPAGSTLNVNTGNFQFYYLSPTSTPAQDSAFASLANGYLQAATSYGGPALFQVNKLVNATYQDFVTVTAVPEPAPYAMLLAGLTAVGFIARRRSR